MQKMSRFFVHSLRPCVLQFYLSSNAEIKKSTTRTYSPFHKFNSWKVHTLFKWNVIDFKYNNSHSFSQCCFMSFWTVFPSLKWFLFEILKYRFAWCLKKWNVEHIFYVFSLYIFDLCIYSFLVVLSYTSFLIKITNRCSFFTID